MYLRSGDTVAVCTLHAEPRTLGDLVQADAVGMIWRVTAVTQEQNVLMIGSVANWTWCRFLLFLGVLVEPCEWIELGNLFLVFNGIFGQKVS